MRAEYATTAIPKLRVLDLFAGVGGFALGLERTGGFETVAFSEIEPRARRVLAAHWPEVPIHGDVATLGPVGPVDVVTAGFPCQDISQAGLRAGVSGERSGLFWHVLRTVRMVGRPLLLLENVADLLHRGMGTVLGALASSGYDAEWDCISTGAVKLPVRRQRVFIVAEPHGERQLQPYWRVEDEWRWFRDGIQAPVWPLPDCGGGGSRDGLSSRLDLIGNAVSPLIAELHGNAILAAETHHTRRLNPGASAGRPERQPRPGRGVLPARVRADKTPPPAVLKGVLLRAWTAGNSGASAPAFYSRRVPQLPGVSEGVPGLFSPEGGGE